MTTLVTGGTGFVGRALLRRLAEEGSGRVRVLARPSSDTSGIEAAGAEIVRGDVTDGAAVGRACERVGLVFHLAALVQEAGVPDRLFREVHVEGTRHLIEAAAAAGAGRVVHVSTTGVHGHVTGPPADEDAPVSAADIYQVTKWEGERLALDLGASLGLPVVVARPAAVYGPGDRRLLKLFRFIADGRFRMIGSGKTLIHPIYVDDLVEGLLACARVPGAAGRAYILGGDRPVSLNELTAAISREVGRRLRRPRIPYFPVWLASAACEVACKPFGIEPPLYRRRAEFFVKNRAFRIDRARSELGFDPKVGLDEGVRRTVAGYRASGWLPAARPANLTARAHTQ